MKRIQLFQIQQSRCEPPEANIETQEFPSTQATGCFDEHAFSQPTSKFDSKGSIQMLLLDKPGLTKNERKPPMRAQGGYVIHELDAPM